MQQGGFAMFRKSLRLLALMTLIALLVPSQALAAEGGGSGPHDTLAPNGTWTSVEAGHKKWYSFLYEGDESQITISMQAVPEDGAHFEVYLPCQVRGWGLGEDDEPCGCGTKNDALDMAHFWAGNFNCAGTYYILVEHSGSRQTPTYYSILAGGESVYARPPTVQITHGTPAAAPAPAAPERAAQPAESRIGLNAGYEQMQIGHDHWVKFEYVGDESQVTVALDVKPTHGATFSVYTPEQMRKYKAGQDVEPVGRGSDSEYAAGDLFWSGKFTSPGTYYVRVEHGGGIPSWCKLTIAGDGVRL
jgi:hypothetical protein